MLFILLVIPVLAWPPDGRCTALRENGFSALSCFRCAFSKDSDRFRGSSDSTNITCRPCWRKIENTYTWNGLCAFVWPIDSSKHRSQASGNGKVTTRILEFQARLDGLEKPLQANGERSLHTKATCSLSLQLGALPNKYVLYRCTFHATLPSDLLKHVNNIKYGGYFSNLIKQGGSIRHVALLCKKRFISNPIGNKREKTGFRTREKIMLERSRKRRDVMGNISKSSSLSAYLPASTSNSRALPVTPFRIRSPPTPNLRSRPTPLLSCPRSAVIDKSTIFFRSAASRGRMNVTLVPTSDLTPLPKTVLPSALKTVSGNDSARASEISGAQMNITAYPPSRMELRTSRGNVTFIYKSQLVSIVRSASNLNSALITAFDCATVTTTTAWSSVAINPTQITSSATVRSEEQMQWIVGLAFTGGALLTIVMIVVLIILIRRYRRRQALRKKAKQISYFNRYDRSSAWDDEPSGGSRLSVFTLKNSKFDIDSDSANEMKKDGKYEDFEGT